MKTFLALVMLLLSVISAHAQFGIGGSSIVFDPSVYARQLDQFLQQAQYWGAELQPLVNAAQLFQQPLGFSNVMDTLNKVQSINYSVQGLSWAMQTAGQVGNIGAGCQGVLCINQAQNVGMALNGGSNAMQYASQLYNQVQAGLSATAWGAAANPNPQPPSAGYLVPPAP